MVPSAKEARGSEDSQSRGGQVYFSRLRSPLPISTICLSSLNQACWTPRASQRGVSRETAASCAPEGAIRVECLRKRAALSKHMVTDWTGERGLAFPSAPAQGCEWEKPWAAGFCAHYI